MGQSEENVWRDILEMYRDLPCLWKTNHDQYHNRDVRSQAMSLLYEKYKSLDKDVTLAVFKKKLENMRTSYGRERKKILNSTQTGASSDNVYVPTLWYYELLTFLDEKDIAARNGEETEVSDDKGTILELPPAKKRKIALSFKRKMSHREKNVWRDIFEVYHDLPCLWKTNHKQYNNKDVRSQAMSLLYEKYKSFDKDITLASFKKKLENMRTSYGRERKKIMNSTQMGASSDDVYVPKLWYYDLLTFLDEKDIATNGEETEVSDDEELQPAKRKIESSFQIKQEQLFDVSNKIRNVNDDDWDVIGRSFGVQLRDLTANQKIIARKLISDVIFYGSTEQLTHNSYISVSSLTVIPSPSPSPTSVSFPHSSPQYE